MNPEKLSNPLFTLTVGEFIELIEKINRDLVNQKTKEIVVPQKVENEIMTIGEAADFLKIKKSSLYKMNCDRKVPYLKKNKRVLYKRSELLEWLNEGKVMTQKELEQEAIANLAMRVRKR